MRFRLLKYLTPVIIPAYRIYVSSIRKFRYKNIHVLVRPGVFFPGFIISTKMFLRYIEKLDLSGKTLLELGAGSGIISILAASKKAIVTASDINPLAVQNIRENALLNHVELTVLESDLFEKIPKSIFDFIVIAPPYYPKDPMNYADMAWFCGKNFEYFEKLFLQLPGYYYSSTRVLMILSEDCDISKIKEIAARQEFKFQLLLSKKTMGEWNYIFSLYKND